MTVAVTLCTDCSSRGSCPAAEKERVRIFSHPHVVFFSSSFFPLFFIFLLPSLYFSLYPCLLFWFFIHILVSLYSFTPPLSRSLFIFSFTFSLPVPFPFLFFSSSPCLLISYSTSPPPSLLLFPAPSLCCSPSLLEYYLSHVHSILILCFVSLAVGGSCRRAAI